MDGATSAIVILNLTALTRPVAGGHRHKAGHRPNSGFESLSHRNSHDIEAIAQIMWLREPQPPGLLFTEFVQVRSLSLSN